MLINLKRDAISIYFLLHFILFLSKKQYASCLETISKIEFLESNISGALAALLHKIMRNKYDAAKCTRTDPFIVSSLKRYATDGQKKFLASNIVVLKSYISPNEKGVILLKYSEVINAFPFLFDMQKVQERYHMVVEPSTESPYQMFYKFYQNTSLTFVQALSEREIAMDKEHGFYSVPVCAGDWINENKFSRIENAPLEYDFCAVANFIAFKRHIYLLSAISNYWKGDLKFALIASSHIGEKRPWIENLIKKNNLEGKVDVFMDIAPEQVSQLLNRSKCHVLCSLREGANKANFESMFIGTPVVVHRDHIGFPNFRFAPPLVVNYTTPMNLVEAIKKCATVDRDQVYKQARNLIGSGIATQTLNDCIKKATTAIGGEWTKDIYRKVNNVQAFYFYPADALNCIDDFKFLQEVLIDKECYDYEFAINKFSTAKN